VQKIGKRWYPMHILFRDLLKSGGGTELITLRIAFDQPVPEPLFSEPP